MKDQTTPPRLLSKRMFARKQASLQQRHHWILKGKPLEVRPGWMNILDTAFCKIKNILTEEDIEQSRLEFLFTSSRFNLKIFTDGERLSRSRFNAIEYILNEATAASELMCAKCGCELKQFSSHLHSGLCDEHREFDGDFSEDRRRFVARKKAKARAEAAARIRIEKEEAEARALAAEEECKVAVVEESPEEVIADASTPLLCIYDVTDVKSIMSSLRTRSADVDSRGRLKALCEEMIKLGGERPYCLLPDPAAFDDLALRFPNMKEPIEVIRSAVVLAQLGDGRLEIPPLLLVGPPGIGKTQIANEIASLFKTSFKQIHMESEQTGASISGSSEFWSNTQTGVIFDTLVKGRTANPMILLDELDKSGGDTRFDPAAGLYGLLERESAKRFEDMSIRGLHVDASAIIWMITANDESRIPVPILSRTMVQHVRPPTRDETIRIAQSLYASIRNSRAWGSRFQPTLPDSVAEKLAAFEPRKMKTCLIYAFGRAAITGRDIISPDDLPMAKAQRPFGFLPASAPDDKSSAAGDTACAVHESV